MDEDEAHAVKVVMEFYNSSVRAPGTMPRNVWDAVPVAVQAQATRLKELYGMLQDGTALNPVSCVCPGCLRTAPKWYAAQMCYECESEDCDHD